MTTNTIDDLANDPIHERHAGTSEQSRKIAIDLEPHFKGLIGKPATAATADEVIKILYDAGPKGEAPILAQILAKYGIKSQDYQTLVAQYGIPREELKKDLVKAGEMFSISDILRVAQTLANRYHSKTLEAEPARLTNLASKHGVKPVLDKMLESVKMLYGEAAVKAEKIRQSAVTSVQDFQQYVGQHYGDSFRRYSTATAR